MATTTKGNTSEKTTHDARSEALTFLFQEAESLPPDEKKLFFKLIAELEKETDPEDRASLKKAIVEILVPSTGLAGDILKKGVAGGVPKKSWAAYAGGKIKEIRKRVKMSQEELAAKSGLPQSHISRIEGGNHSPSHKTVVKIAKALGVEVKEIDPSAS